MPGWSSTAPAALAALLAALQAAPALAAPVDVRDGLKVGNSAATDAVIVGWNGKPGEALAIDATTGMEGLSGDPDREQYTIACAALSLNGAGDMTAARAGAYALLSAAGAAIAANRTLGGVVLRAGIVSHSLLQEPVQAGARATVQFGVGVDAYTAG